MLTQHDFAVAVEWTGDRGTGTTGYRDFDRGHVIRVDGLPEIQASADRAFHGDASKHNPEQLLLAALSGCHMMSYLFHAVRAGIVVTGYEDDASAVLAREGTGGKLVGATLRPRVRLSAGDDATALRIHDDAHRDCFIANSIAFPVTIEPTVVREEAA
ncbi:MAG TPA: OsmC family protein [Candidatus Agrococcus pullicola]|uniref:OsmC family protein n=1 Tax=Candidatus Agrococcus pullicola TaxID=2838429 RepID=A0A9D1YWT4_9MICO|nr:OsmC family protein [Candidatus Agrococcus pullicola]